MKKIKSAIKSSAVFAILGFLPLAANFFLLPFITSKLDPEQFGVITLAVIVQGIISVLMQFGIDASLTRFYYRYYKRRKSLYANYSTGIFFILGMASIIFVLMWFFGDSMLNLLFKVDLFKFKDYGLPVFGLSIANVLFVVLSNYYRNEENLKMFAVLSITVLVLSLSGMIIGVWGLNWKAYGYIWGRSIAFVLSVFIFLIVFFWNKPIMFRYKSLKPMMKYGIPFVPHFFLLMVNTSLDKWIMERYFDLDRVGEYNFAFQIASLCSVFTFAVFNAVAPRIYKMMTDDEIQHTNGTEVSRLFGLFHLFVVFVISGLVAVIAPVTELLIKNQDYHAILDYVNLLALAWLPQMYYMIYSVPVMFYHKTSYLPIITASGLIAGIASSLLLIPIWGIYGVCVSTILIKAIAALTSYLLSENFNIMHHEYFQLGRNHVLALMVGGAIILIHPLIQGVRGVQLYLMNCFPFMVFLTGFVLLFRREIRLMIKTWSRN